MEGSDSVKILTSRFTPDSPLGQVARKDNLSIDEQERLYRATMEALLSETGGSELVVLVMGIPINGWVA